MRHANTIRAGGPRHAVTSSPCTDGSGVHIALVHTPISGPGDRRSPGDARGGDILFSGERSSGLHVVPQPSRLGYSPPSTTGRGACPARRSWKWLRRPARLEPHAYAACLTEVVAVSPLSGSGTLDSGQRVHRRSLCRCRPERHTLAGMVLLRGCRLPRRLARLWANRDHW